MFAGIVRHTWHVNHVKSRKNHVFRIWQNHVNHVKSRKSRMGFFGEKFFKEKIQGTAGRRPAEGPREKFSEVNFLGCHLFGQNFLKIFWSWKKL